MTSRCFKCTRFRKGILDYSLECITLLKNDFFKQRYITFNVTIPGQDSIDPNTYLCRTFYWVYICIKNKASDQLRGYISHEKCRFSQYAVPMIVSSKFADLEDGVRKVCSMELNYRLPVQFLAQFHTSHAF